MHVYITKYALTDGIWERDAEVSKHNANRILFQEKNHYYAFTKPNWHETREAALEHAEQMRAKKLKSLRKQIAKLESLRFE